MINLYIVFSDRFLKFENFGSMKFIVSADHVTDLCTVLYFILVLQRRTQFPGNLMIFVIFSGLVWVEGTKLLEPAGALQLMHAPETSHDLDKTRKIRFKTFWTGVSSRQHNIRYRILCCLE